MSCSFFMFYRVGVSLALFPQMTVLVFCTFVSCLLVPFYVLVLCFDHFFSSLSPWLSFILLRVLFSYFIRNCVLTICIHSLFLSFSCRGLFLSQHLKRFSFSWWTRFYWEFFSLLHFVLSKQCSPACVLGTVLSFTHRLLGLHLSFYSFFQCWKWETTLAERKTSHPPHLPIHENDLFFSFSLILWRFFLLRMFVLIYR